LFTIVLVFSLKIRRLSFFAINHRFIKNKARKSIKSK